MILAVSVPAGLEEEIFSAYDRLGVRFGSWLLERGLTPKYGHMGSGRLGRGGLAEQIANQGLEPLDIKKRVLTLLAV